MWREIDFVNHQQIGPRDSRPAFAGDLVATRDVDDVDERIHEFGTKCGREIITSALDENQLQAGMCTLQCSDGIQVHRGIFSDRRMRTPSGLDAQHTVRWQNALAYQKLGVLSSVNIIRDYCQVYARPKSLAQDMHQRRLSTSYRTCNTKPECSHIFRDQFSTSLK